MKTRTNEPSDQPLYLTIAEICAEFGGSDSFWRKVIRETPLPVTYFGRNIRVKREVIENYLQSRTTGDPSQKRD
jgi:excisionase family DNA binding protein